MIVEVIFRIGDGPRGKDGMPLAVMGEGFLLTKAHIVTYMQSDVLPAGFLALDENLQDGVLRRLMQIRYLTGTERTVGQVATKKWGLRYTTGTEAQRTYMEAIAEGLLAGAAADRALVLEHGLDTNWGFSDLKLFGIIRADLPPAVVEDLVSPELDETTHPYEDPKFLRFRKWRVPYQVLVPGNVAAWQDRNQHVPVDRAGTVFTVAQIREAAQA